MHIWKSKGLSLPTVDFNFARKQILFNFHTTYGESCHTRVSFMGNWCAHDSLHYMEHGDGFQIEPGARDRFRDESQRWLEIVD